MLSNLNKKSSILSWIYKNRLLLVFFVVYLVVSFIALYFHENWEDEAQAWLTARDCSFFELLGRMKYEGHFLPWYLILMPFAKLGFSYSFMNIISWSITSVSAWLMLKYLPLRRLWRILLIFTLPMLYFFPVVSRCYCLFPLSIILMIMFYKDRFGKPYRYLLALTLSALTHVHCLVFAFIAGLDFFIGWLKKRKTLEKIENRRIIWAICLTVILVGFSCLLLVGSVNGASGINLEIADFKALTFISSNTTTFLGIYATFLPTEVVFFIFSILFSLIAINYFGVFTRLSFCVLWQFFVQTLVFSLPLSQRMLLPWFFFVFFFCCAKIDEIKFSPLSFRKKVFLESFLILLAIFNGLRFYNILATVFFFIAFTPNIVSSLKIPADLSKCRRLITPFFILVLGLSIVDGFYNVYQEINYTFTDSLMTAKYIEEELIDDDSSVLFFTTVESNNIYTSVIAYLNEANPKLRFYDAKDNFFYSYSPITVGGEADRELDFKSICNNYDHCYYIVPQAIGSIRETVREFKEIIGEKPFLDEQVENGSLKEIYDSMVFDDGWALSLCEYFKIYEVVARE